MVRIGIVGTSGIGAKHFSSLLEIPEAQVTALIDIDKESARRLSPTSPELIIGTTIEEALPVVDAIYICTPPDSHLELARKAFAAGKHVFCEKPITTTIDEATTMIQLSETSKKILGIGFNMRFRPSYEQMKKIVDSGVLGDPIFYWCIRLGRLEVPPTNWRVSEKHRIGMTIESLSHEFDTIRWLFGEVASVHANISESGMYLPGFDDNARMHLSLDNGVHASIIASWSSCLAKSSRGIVGTKGTIELEGDDIWNCNSIRLKVVHDTESKTILCNERLDPSAYTGINRTYIDAIKRGNTKIPTGIDGIQALRIALAAKESSSQGGNIITL